MATTVYGRILVCVNMGFCKLSPLTSFGEGESVLAEKWEERIEEYLNALEVQNDVTCVGFVNS